MSKKVLSIYFDDAFPVCFQQTINPYLTRPQAFIKYFWHKKIEFEFLHSNLKCFEK